MHNGAWTKPFATGLPYPGSRTAAYRECTMLCRAEVSHVCRHAASAQRKVLEGELEAYLQLPGGTGSCDDAGAGVGHYGGGLVSGRALRGA